MAKTCFDCSACNGVKEGASDQGKKHIFHGKKKKLKTGGYFNEFQRNHPRQPENEMRKYVLGVLHAQLVQSKFMQLASTYSSINRRLTMLR